MEMFVNQDVSDVVFFSSDPSSHSKIVQFGLEMFLKMFLIIYFFKQPIACRTYMPGI